MDVDYSRAEQTLDLSFQSLNRRRRARLEFPPKGALSAALTAVCDGNPAVTILPHQQIYLFSTAGVEMWHRAIHSFLWSVALTKGSPLWSSVTGYYASHFVMRAFANIFGIAKLFQAKRCIQVFIDHGQFACSTIASKDGEHAFYWKAVKGYPDFLGNPLFRLNSERDHKSESSHRTFANYVDHISSFLPLQFPDVEVVADKVERISRIRLHSVAPPSRDDYPDLENVQILAYQRIVTFRDFLDERLTNNDFWDAHRNPNWCENVMMYKIEDAAMELPVTA